jgi:putative hydroxymethylpyrimidine transport system permease protein
MLAVLRVLEKVAELTLRASRARVLHPPTSVGPLRAYELHGPGEGDYLLVHGLGASSAGWVRLARRLRRHARRVVLVDLPAHGNSARPTEGFNPDTLGAGVREAFPALLASGPPVTLVGNSLGGAVALGYALERPEAVRSLVLPVLLLSQAMPIFALAPILTLWLGYGFWSKVAMAMLIVFFPITSSFFDGLMRTPRGFLDLGGQLKGRPARVMWHIRIPTALPSLASGLRMAAVYAPVGAIIGEWVGASQGLGYLMLFANGRAKIDLMFAALAVLLMVTLALRFMAEVLCRFMLARYPAA